MPAWSRATTRSKHLELAYASAAYEVQGVTVAAAHVSLGDNTRAAAARQRALEAASKYDAYDYLGSVHPGPTSLPRRPSHRPMSRPPGPGIGR